MPPPSADLDIRIKRFAQDASNSMSAELAASIAGVGRDTMYDLCRSGQINAQGLATKKHDGKNAHTRWSISPAALLRYIVLSTTGDRTIVLEAIHDLCPVWIRSARAWAKEPFISAPAPASAAAARKERTPRDPYASHPDFFLPSSQGAEA